MDNSPKVKFEHSPAESFVSTPGTMYPTLFPEGMDSHEAMSPQSYEDESMFGGSMPGTPAPEKKPVKKRKSWGQQLPEPKTNLPPRYVLGLVTAIINHKAN
jgi:transcriptional activator HAC1